MAIYKFCSNCNKKYDASLKECDKCGGSKKARFKRYADNRKDKENQTFYQSRGWGRCREDIKRRDKGLCLYCLFVKKEFNVMNLVHHIIEEKEDKSLRLVKDNLICLCDDCHRKVHKEYEKSNESKFQLQNKLKDLVELSKKKINLSDNSY